MQCGSRSCLLFPAVTHTDVWRIRLRVIFFLVYIPLLYHIPLPALVVFRFCPDCCFGFSIGTRLLVCIQISWFTCTCILPWSPAHDGKPTEWLSWKRWHLFSWLLTVVKLIMDKNEGVTWGGGATGGRGRRFKCTCHAYSCVLHLYGGWKCRDDFKIIDYFRCEI